jgi:hypothetical protein
VRALRANHVRLRVVLDSLLQSGHPVVLTSYSWGTVVRHDTLRSIDARALAHRRPGDLGVAASVEASKLGCRRSTRADRPAAGSRPANASHPMTSPARRWWCTAAPSPPTPRARRTGAHLAPQGLGQDRLRGPVRVPHDPPRALPGRDGRGAHPSDSLHGGRHG